MHVANVGFESTLDYRRTRATRDWFFFFFFSYRFAGSRNTPLMIAVIIFSLSTLRIKSRTESWTVPGCGNIFFLERLGSQERREFFTFIPLAAAVRGKSRFSR